MNVYDDIAVAIDLAANKATFRGGLNR